MVRSAPAGHHIADEPLPDFHRQLVPRFPTVDVRNAALSTKSGERSFTYVRSLPTHSGFLSRKYPGPQELERITVRVEALDSDHHPGMPRRSSRSTRKGLRLRSSPAASRRFAARSRSSSSSTERARRMRTGTTPDDVFDLLCRPGGASPLRHRRCRSAQQARAGRDLRSNPHLTFVARPVDPAFRQERRACPGG